MLCRKKKCGHTSRKLSVRAGMGMLHQQQRVWWIIGTRRHGGGSQRPGLLAPLEPRFAPPFHPRPAPLFKLALVPPIIRPPPAELRPKKKLK